MSKSACLIAYLLVILTCNLLVAQENYVVKTFTTEQGLPHNKVREIAQDQNGFLWIATWDGLSRYNGYEFRNYYHNPGDTTSLPYFTAERILVDRENQVWVMPALSGLALYNRSFDGFIQIKGNEQNSGLTLDHENGLWWITQQKIRKWNYQKKQFEPLEILFDIEKPEGIFVNINFDNQRNIWLRTQKKNGEENFYLCTNSSLPQLHFKFLGKIPDSFNQPIPSNGLYSQFPLVTSGGFYVNNNSRLYKLDQYDHIFKVWKKTIPKEELHDIFEPYRVDFLHKLEFFNENLRLSTISSPGSFLFTEAFLSDRQGTNWLSSTLNARDATGLTRAIPNPKWFRHYFTDFKNNGQLNAIFPVKKDRFGTLWAGPVNRDGIFRLDKDGRLSEENLITKDVKDKVRGPRVFFEDKSGMWIGYYSSLLQFYDFQQRKYSTVLLKKTKVEDTSQPHNFIHIVPDGQSLIIFGYLSVFSFNPNSGKIKQIYLSEYPNAIFSVWRTNNGEWWLGFGHEKIRHFDKDFNLIKEYNLGNRMFNMEDILPGDNNDLWLSTLGGGLIHFDIATEKSKTYTTADGLSNNTCYGMLKDKKGNLWISTNRGISRFNPKTNQFRIFGPTDGLKIDEFNSDNTYLAPDGEMFFAGMGGVVSFYPDSISDQQKEPPSPLVIEDFKVSGANRYFKKAIYECDTVVLQKGDNNFEADYACLDFRNADKIKYRYRLSGENDDFVVTDHRHRTVNYSSLLPGKYLLEIEATNRDGDWVSKRSLWVIIPAFYYQTLGFKLLMAFLVILLISYLVYGYNRRIRLIASQKQEELRLESLRGQMNPHFIFNSLNSINYFISQNDRLSANRYIADFSRLIRTILGNTTSDYISLSKELESLHDYLKLEHLRFGDKFDYQVTLAPEISPETMMVSPGLVQPFIENAIWHGVRGLENRKGKIEIRFVPGNSENIVCTVEDDGVGRKLSEIRKSSLPGKTSRGISIILERLKIINKLRKSNFQVAIEDVYPNQLETGTRVTIDIPSK